MSNALRAGSSVSHYRVVSAIGAGGMGEVYKAVDDNLERPVALKVLPPDLVKNDDRVRRFVQEAKSASGLSHPHIVTIYEIGKAEVKNDDDESQAVHFIAMELVDGRTLKREIHEERTDLRVLIGYLAQAADALAKAHAAGIIHRDLKPENIMISRDGYAKILDFGLAKLTERRPDADGSNVRTEVREHTREGVVLGTVGYMAPEQVQGRTVDHRADIFAFGCILYEAATRKKPFDADSDVDVMHKILHDKPPPIDELNPSVPTELRRIIRRCLTKEPDKRYHSMKDLSIELAEIAQEWEELSVSTSGSGSTTSISGGTAVLPRGGGKGIWVVAALAILVALAAVAFAVFQMRKPEAAPGAGFGNMKIQRITGSGDVTNVAISPDGKYVAHVVERGGRSSVRVRQVATGSDVEVVPPGLEIRGVAFSPDGNYVYYMQVESEPSAYASLYQVPGLGGTPRKILFDVDTEPSFSPDGKRFAFIRGFPHLNESAVMLANADGSAARKLAALKNPEGFSTDSAVWSPDGAAVAAVKIQVAPTAHERVVIIDAATGKTRLLGEKTFAEIERLSWLPDGKGLLCVATELASLENRQIWLIDFPGGAARRITNDLSDYFGIGVTADGGTIVAAQTLQTSNLWIVPPGGTPRQATFGTGMKVFEIHARPKNIYFTGVQAAKSSVWVAGADGSNPRPLIDDGQINWGPATPADESFVAFVSMREGNVPKLWRVDADGSNPRKVTDEPLIGQGPSVSPDGRFIVFRAAKPTELKRVPSSGGPAVLITDKLRAGGGYSRDGKTLGLAMYVPDAAGRVDAVIAIIPAEGGPPLHTLMPRSRNYGYGPDNRSYAFVLNEEGVSNLWRHSFDGSEPTRLTSFTSGRIFSWDWGTDGTLYLGRGEESSDVVLITDFR